MLKHNNRNDFFRFLKDVTTSVCSVLKKLKSQTKDSRAFGRKNISYYLQGFTRVLIANFQQRKSKQNHCKLDKSMGKSKTTYFHSWFDHLPSCLGGQAKWSSPFFTTIRIPYHMGGGGGLPQNKGGIATE
jgi:hypothetical protein